MSVIVAIVLVYSFMTLLPQSPDWFSGDLGSANRSCFSSPVALLRSNHMDDDMEDPHAELRRNLRRAKDAGDISVTEYLQELQKLRVDPAAQPAHEAGFLSRHQQVADAVSSEGSSDADGELVDEDGRLWKQCLVRSKMHRLQINCERQSCLPTTNGVWGERRSCIYVCVHRVTMVTVEFKKYLEIFLEICYSEVEIGF